MVLGCTKYISQLSDEGRHLYMQLVNEEGNRTDFKTAVTLLFSTYETVLGRLCTWVYFLLITLWFIAIPIRLEQGSGS